MRKSRGAILLTAAIAASFLNGCQNANTANGTKIYYAAIESGSYYEGWASDLGAQAQMQGMEFDVGYAENSVETQDSQIKNAVDQGCDVFLCGPVSADIVTELKAAAGDTPIVFINNAPDDGQLEQDRYIYVASDEFMAGQYQAEYILDKLGDKEEINVVILKGPKGASGTNGRTNGLKRTLKASGKKINYVFEDHANYNESTAKELMEIFLKTGRTFDCVAANNDDMALGAVAVCEEAGLDTSSILFLGVDASANGCQAISDGRLDFTVYQATSDQIVAAVEAAGKLAAGQSIKEIEGATEDGKYILIPFEKVDAVNVEQYK
ncbi:MAG: sugar ABC transporter substrate-binding protein [Lachnospiraceae bacterium]|nr:sugar ABC transporter substrate-binding protein [Lachnospiraceae bacterium]